MIYVYSFVIFVIYFVCKELIHAKRGGFGYFMSYWNLAEVTIILASLAAIGCYIYRYFLVQAILQEVRNIF